MEIVAVGNSAFSLGFELAGVRAVVVEQANVETTVEALMDEEEVGIVILAQDSFDALSADLRDRVLRAPRPVTVVLSEEESNEELRHMIIRSIGVDLWKSDE